MHRLTVSVETTHDSMVEARPRLDAAFDAEFPGGMLKRRWEGEVLQVSGPGARGSIRLEDGRLVGDAELGPPASMMRDIIERKVRAALETAAT